MNSITRENLGARIGDLIFVRPIEKIPARKICITPAYDFRFLKDPTELLKTKLNYFPLCQGDGIALKGFIQYVHLFFKWIHIPLKLRKAEIKVKVVSTEPKGIVTVDPEKTEITSLTFPYLKLLSKPFFSYYFQLGLMRIKLNMSSFR